MLLGVLQTLIRNVLLWLLGQYVDLAAGELHLLLRALVVFGGGGCLHQGVGTGCCRGWRYLGQLLLALYQQRDLRRQRAVLDPAQCRLRLQTGQRLPQVVLFGASKADERSRV